MIVDITVGEKGGCGKTVVTALRGQYYVERGAKIMGIDTDPSNPGFSAFTGLPVQILPICAPGTNKIIPRQFDELVNRTDDPDAEYMVIDVGTSNVLALLDYLASNDTIGLLQSLGHTVRFHCVIRGASDLKETLEQFASLCEEFPSPEKVVWLNPNIGPIEHEGKNFEQLSVYKTYLRQIHSIIRIPNLDASTFGGDFSRLLTRRETFANALDKTNTGWSVVERHRLGRIWADLKAQMKDRNL